MIISASRRTDIPAFFSDWFIKRIEERYAYVRNPMNIHQVSRINLSPNVIDCIVFWSKNPEPMLKKLDKLQDYTYYFQFTLNAYEDDIEKNLPSLDKRINTFLALSNLLGKQRVIWRYDPIIINDKYTLEWHIDKYSYIAGKLYKYTEKSTISFIDLYTKIISNIKDKQISELSYDIKMALAKELSSIACSYGIKIDTCAEDIDLSICNIEHARCIDDRLIAKLLGCSIDVEKDKNQRLECGCVSSIDLGLYNTCQNGCIYCYANHNINVRKRNFQAYDKNSPLLCSEITELDKITERKVKSQKNMQIDLFSM